jgi:hypothetical protein
VLNLAEQLITICSNDTVLSVTNPSGPSITRADSSRTIPWIVIVWLPGTQILRTQDGANILDYVVSFTITATSSVQAITLLDRLKALFDGKSFALPNGDTCVQSYLHKPPTVREGRRLPVFPMCRSPLPITNQPR